MRVLDLISDNPACFIDRDGTIIENKHYLSDPTQVELLTGAVKGLRKIQSAGYKLVMVSNQSGVGRGYFTSKEVDAVNNKLIEMLGHEEITFDLVLFCPHSPVDGCDCRKPSIGMVNQATAKLKLNVERSFVIGDSAVDLELGDNLGITSYLVGNQDIDPSDFKKCIKVKSIADAADHFLDS